MRLYVIVKEKKQPVPSADELLQKRSAIGTTGNAVYQSHVSWVTMVMSGQSAARSGEQREARRLGVKEYCLMTPKRLK